MYYNGAGVTQPSSIEEAKKFYFMFPSEAVNNYMEPEHKTQWITALRSGEYEQIQGSLCLNKFEEDGLTSKPGHCCLGVLAEIEGVEKFNLARPRVAYKFPRGSQSKILDSIWAESLGIKTRTGHFGISFEMFGEEFYQEYELAALNDDGFTFDQIADVIECFF